MTTIPERCWDCGREVQGGVCTATHRPGAYLRGRATRDVIPSAGVKAPNGAAALRGAA